MAQITPPFRWQTHVQLRRRYHSGDVAKRHLQNRLAKKAIQRHRGRLRMVDLAWPINNRCRTSRSTPW